MSCSPSSKADWYPAGDRTRTIPRGEAEEGDPEGSTVDDRGVRAGAGDQVGAVRAEAAEHRTVLAVGHRDGSHGAEAIGPAR